MGYGPDSPQVNNYYRQEVFMRVRRVGKPLGVRDPVKVAARRKALTDSLIGNLNANVLKDNPEPSETTENISKNGDSDDKRPTE